MKAWMLLLAAVPLVAQDTTQTPDAQAAPAAQEANPVPAAAPAEQTVTGSVDLGYRWFTGVGGSADAYRSVVNFGSGPRLLGLDLTLVSPSLKFFDKINVRAEDWGGDPYRTAHVDAERHDWYSFTFDYRNLTYFNFLPSFADPTIGTGIFLDQQSFDTRRRMMDFELDLRPGKRIVPYLAYSHDSGYGTGTSDFVNGLNSYAVADKPRDATENYRGGVRVEMQKFHITLEQGGTTFKDDQQVFTGTQNFGNNPAPFLSEQLSLTDLMQAYGMRGDSIYSKVLVTGNPTPWLDVFGQFLYSQPKTNVNYSQYNVGEFVDLATLLFYTSELDLVNGAAKQPHTTGTAGFEVRPMKRLRVIESFMTDRLHDASAAALNQQIFTLAVAQNQTPAAATLLSSFTDLLVMNYNSEQVDALYDLTSRITVRGGYRYEWGDGLTQGALISGVPTETGTLKRNVGLAGVSYRALRGLSFSIDFEGADGDKAYFRTSLQNYEKARIQARYEVKPSLVLAAGFTVLNNENPNPAVNYNFLSRDNSLSFTWNPNSGKWVTVTGEYTRATLRSDLSYIVPETFTSAQSFYRDNAHDASTMVDLLIPGFGAKGPKLGMGGSMLLTSGSRPTQYYQPVMRLTTPTYKRMNWYGEWRYYGFGEPFYLYEGFRAHLLTLGVRVGL